MNLVFILMRHAKSSWSNPFLSDFDRPLNRRGRQAAIDLGNWLRRESFYPEEVLISGAVRTFQTFESLELEIEPKYERSLYMAGSDTMFSVLVTATRKSVLMIAHNPGIADFAERLVRRCPDHHRFRDYPTGATLVVRFDQERWEDIRPKTGLALRFVIPRELADV